ncbi:hypothetical protein [Clostridium perfringens]|uniref:Uncharacterized protein n=1 Tax=Clostridium perfringens E str. JGS1987 TaxID=451755 RepID=B1BPP1_CLOPF|nr:hypothetical protein [Clostridium perfringens]EDT16272.1 hypothetical protein AC3_2572 [Clostridium perfringens E str. JGS1987]
MDARRMSLNAIKEGLEKGMYEITGVLETGEIVVAISGDIEKEFKRRILDITFISNSRKIIATKKLISEMGRPAREIMQIYKQCCDLNVKRCPKNNLRIR